MPPKSTWFEPKLRDGLLSHVDLTASRKAALQAEHVQMRLG